MATALLPVIRKLPLANVFFVDLFWIGVAMILVLGIPNSVAAVMLVRRDARQYQVALVAALLLICWCGFELIYIFNVAAVGYLVVGIVSVLCVVLLLGRSQEASARKRATSSEKPTRRRPDCGSYGSTTSSAASESIDETLRTMLASPARSSARTVIVRGNPATSGK